MWNIKNILGFHVISHFMSDFLIIIIPVNLKIKPFVSVCPHRC